MLRQFSSACCKRCGNYAPVRNTGFHRHIGMIVLMHHSQIETLLCRRCADEIFWQYTLTTLFLGWWGMISFFITPFILVYNVVRYLGVLSLPKPSPAPGKPMSTPPIPPPIPAMLRSTTPLPAPPPISPSRTTGPIQAPIALAPNEYELDVTIQSSPQIIAAGTRLGRYSITEHTANRLGIKCYSPLSFYCGLTALGCMVASALGFCAALAGHRESAELLIFLPFGLGCTLIWLRLVPGKIRIDAPTQRVSLSSARTTVTWNSSDFYAVYIDSTTARNAEPMLDITIAERVTSNSWGGTRIVRCPISDPSCVNMVQLAATVSQMLHLPVRYTEEARHAATSPRLRALLVPKPAVATLQASSAI